MAIEFKQIEHKYCTRCGKCVTSAAGNVLAGMLIVSEPEKINVADLPFVKLQYGKYFIGNKMSDDRNFGKEIDKMEFYFCIECLLDAMFHVRFK